MGQRLVIHMLNDSGKEVANAYYHWSAYTSSAIYELKGIADALQLIQDGNIEKWIVTESICKYYHTDINALNDVELATVLLYATGAGIRNIKESIGVLLDNEEKRLRIPIISAIDRNEGLIDLTEEGIKDSNDWSEGDAYVHLRSGLVDFNVYAAISEWYEEWYVEQEIETLDDSIDLYRFELKDIDKISNIIEKLPMKDSTGTIIDTIA